ncbi:MAG: hypothetical protein FJX86_04775 [Bacteroidetes bacterium]|nr:hypothetical protein [Bacteroidota bacterium]
MFKRLLLFLVVLLAYKPLLAQNNKISHSFNLTGGTFFIYNQVAFHYELLEERRYVHTFIQGGLSLGIELLEGQSFTTPYARLGFLAGANSHYFEAAGGVCLFMTGDGASWLPSATVGYRNLNLDGRSIVRFGIGLPEAIYFGYGWRL